METFLMYTVIILIVTQAISFILILRLRKGVTTAELSLGTAIPSIKAFSFTHNKQVVVKKLIRKPTLIVFVTPHSRACRKLLEECRLSYNQNEGMLDLISIVIGGEPEGRKLLKDVMMPGEHLWDPTKEVFHQFGVQIVPYAFAVNKNGVIEDKGVCGTKEQIDILTEPLFQ
ncbi:redoxin domain-containing protein [Anaerobacillus sp. CMMVII]|uniref:peroxiredoxin family protein n=1 Tax=Anaerobacillus sp. CMMVII TaxID=2755588 RepID=UPI0021B74D19|nr:redoxin domain-containing protein [Anaerobacillus sp. CMMVII]MCT8139281.1 redoxin domain-containing protein [Anaerobacillus sp. CMMVII]